MASAKRQSPAEPAGPWPAPDTDIKTVAVMSSGDRGAKITRPLETTPLDVRHNPSVPNAGDVIICDTPDRTMFETLVRSRFHGTPVVFRMRGDPFWGLEEWIDSRLKRWLAREMITHVDGCIAIAPHQANKYRRKTGVRTREVPLPVDADEWPSGTHTDHELRLVTLTNAVYWPKIRPLIDIAPVVESVLDEVGGHWRIGSWSEGYADRLADATAELEHVSFEGHLDAHDALGRANAMLHFSNMDVLPNAILEGLASRLPVITNAHIAFTQVDAPLLVCRDEDELRTVLNRMVDPERREGQGREGEDYVIRRHAPERIGEQFLDALRDFASERGSA